MRSGTVHPRFGIQDFKNNFSLFEEVIATIIRWADAGAPLSNPADMPAPLPWQAGLVWKLKEIYGCPPDLVVRSQPNKLPAENAVRHTKTSQRRRHVVRVERRSVTCLRPAVGRRPGDLNVSAALTEGRGGVRSPRPDGHSKKSNIRSERSVGPPALEADGTSGQGRRGTGTRAPAPKQSAFPSIIGSGSHVGRSGRTAAPYHPR